LAIKEFSHCVWLMSQNNRAGPIPPRERDSSTMKYAAAATLVFMFLGKRCLQQEERKTLPACCSVDTTGGKTFHQLSPNHQRFHHVTEKYWKCLTRSRSYLTAINCTYSRGKYLLKLLWPAADFYRFNHLLEFKLNWVERKTSFHLTYSLRDETIHKTVQTENKGSYMVL